MMRDTGKEEELNRISIKVTPPGPRARKIVNDDTKYLATSTKALPIVADHARGAFVRDVDGNVFLDFSTGISVLNIGHIHPYVLEKVENQLHRLWHFAGTDYYYKEQVDAARALAENTPGSFGKKVFFTNSGAESNEAALKLAKTAKKKQQFIAFIGGFHGRTQGALSLTASKSIQRKGFFPSMPGVEHAIFPNPFRNPFGIDGYEEPEELENRTIDFIENYILKTYVHPDNLAGFVVEPIQGEGGYIVPPRNFHRKLRKLADENDAIVIMDEVQTGFGRTGKFFGSEHFGVEPEMMCLAKSIASGIPMGAVVMNEKYNFPEPSLHSNTFGGNPLASVACVATIDVIRKENLLENATKVGGHLKKRLEELMERNIQIGDVRGKGMMLAMDFVKDPKTREPDTKLRNTFEKKAFENGLLSLPTGLSAIRFIPPINLTMEQADMGFEAIEKAFRASL